VIQEGGVTGVRRTPSKAEFFLSLAPDAALQDMLERGKKGQLIGEHRLTIKDLREYWAVKVYIQGVREKPPQQLAATRKCFWNTRNGS